MRGYYALFSIRGLQQIITAFLLGTSLLPPLGGYVCIQGQPREYPAMLECGCTEIANLVCMIALYPKKVKGKFIISLYPH